MKKYGVLRQIMGLFLFLTVIISVMLLLNVNILYKMHEKYLNQTIAMVKNEQLQQNKIIAADQQKKIEMIISVMKEIAPNLIWSFDVATLEIFAKSFVADPLVSSVTFFDDKNMVIAGDQKQSGDESITQQLDLNGEKLGSVAIGMNTNRYKQSLLELNKRISRFEHESAKDLQQMNRRRNNLLGITIGVVSIIFFITAMVIKKIIEPITDLTAWTRQIAAGNLDSMEIKTVDNEIGMLNANFTKMVDTLRQATGENSRNNWLKNGQAALDTIMRGEQPVPVLTEKVVSFLATHLKSQVAAFYVTNGSGKFVFSAGYCFSASDETELAFKAGEGFVGQAAVSGRILAVNNVPPGYLRVRSGLGAEDPKLLMIIPFVYNQAVLGVVELGFLEEIDVDVEMFLEQSRDAIAIALQSTLARMKLQEALKTLRELNEENMAQQEELRLAQEAAEQKNRQLQASEELLQSQQEELRVANEELQEKAGLLEKMLAMGPNSKLSNQFPGERS